MNDVWLRVSQNMLRPRVVKRELIKSSNPHTICEVLHFTSFDGEILEAKYVHPIKKAKTLVLMFREHVSFFHLHRYAAQNIAVLALNRRPLSKTVDAFKHLESMPFLQVLAHAYLDGLSLSYLVCDISHTKSSLVTIGDHEGSAVAVAVAALNENVSKCVVKEAYDVYKDERVRTYYKVFDPLHETASHVEKWLGLVDIRQFATVMKGELLQCVAKLYDDLTLQNAKTCVYPKHGEELINHFEDECLKFIVR